MRTVGAAVRLALIEEAADRLGVPATELTTADSKVIHAKSGKSLRYGELAAGAATRSFVSQPTLKTRDQFKLIGKPVPRGDIPAKVDGSAVYGIDFTLPDMRVATIAAAPVRGGKLLSVDEKPALAVAGVGKVIKLDDAVIVVAKRYWQAQKGLKALSPSSPTAVTAVFPAPRSSLRRTRCARRASPTTRAATAMSMPLSALRGEGREARLPRAVPPPRDDGAVRAVRALQGRQADVVGRAAGSALHPRSRGQGSGHRHR